MAILSPYSSSFLDTRFCNEEQEHEDELTQSTITDSSDLHHIHPLNLKDLSWEHEELVSLFTKEQEQQMHTPCTFSFDQTGPSLSLARKEAVDWILKVKAYYGFTPLTAILAINYLDRFISSIHFQNNKPWMMQLVAVSCLSLAAKVQETHVPLLLDLQVEDTKFLFEAKNIQKMELLVMSTLKWRMNPVTPISFLDHIVRRLRLLSSHVHWDFFKKCEAMILHLVSDSRFMCYKPSVLATAAMLCVVDEIDPTNSIGYKSQLLDLLNTSKDNINECYELVMDISCDNQNNKRKRDGNETTTYPNSTSNARDSSLKKKRIDQQLGLVHL
ncbi:cyclin-D3-1-like [Bidens hawaiensis]|uniref:cyclin-D3-1-like n=1 Tax=Bidens hawaiensis TaxID=980011 RepID=UPI00404B0110